MKETGLMLSVKCLLTAFLIAFFSANCFAQNQVQVIGNAPSGIYVPPTDDYEIMSREPKSALERYRLEDILFLEQGDSKAGCLPYVYVMDPDHYLHKLYLYDAIGNISGRTMEINEDYVVVRQIYWTDGERIEATKTLFFSPMDDKPEIGRALKFALERYRLGDLIFVQRGNTEAGCLQYVYVMDPDNYLHKLYLHDPVGNSNGILMEISEDYIVVGESYWVDGMQINVSRSIKLLGHDLF